MSQTEMQFNELLRTVYKCIIKDGDNLVDGGKVKMVVAMELRFEE